MLVNKIKLIEAQFRASPRARNDRKDKYRENKRAGDFDAVRFFENDADRRIKKHKACGQIAPMESLPPSAALLQPQVDEHRDRATRHKHHDARGVGTALRD